MGNPRFFLPQTELLKETKNVRGFEEKKNESIKTYLLEK